jgi:SAM-dependent methyltransferase
MNQGRNRLVIENYETMARAGLDNVTLSGRYFDYRFNGYEKFLGQHISELLAITEGDDILDIGCNTGIYHPYLSKYFRSLTGVDAAESSIERARTLRGGDGKFRYHALDVFDFSPETRFNKFILWSLVPFLDDEESVAKLLRLCLERFASRTRSIKILLGEVRDPILYENFIQSRSSPSFRNLKYALLKYVNRFQTRKLITHSGLSPMLLSEAFISDLCKKFGLRYERIEEASRHPYYNTCVDYVLYN